MSFTISPKSPTPITKLIVAGGRGFSDKVLMRDTLSILYKDGIIDTDTELVCGMAKGADIMAYDMFKAAELKYKEFPADWKDMSEPCIPKRNKFGMYNANAGMKRNHAMGDYADGLLAFWDWKSTGTKDMLDYMKWKDRPIYVVRYGIQFMAPQPTLDDLL